MISVCIVIATYNAQRTLERCLRSIFSQDYFSVGAHHDAPVQVIIVDGGSTDETLAICNKFSVRVIIKKNLDSESAKAVGLKATKADVYCDMAADNYLPERDFIKKLMKPINQGDTDASYPERYYYDKNDSLLNRYFALMGVNDPVALYLGKQDRTGYLTNWTNLTNLYEIVEFEKENMPTLGANGFFIKRELLLKADIKNFYHIDVIYDLIKKYDSLKFAVVKTSIGHDTGENLWGFLKKRRRYFENLYLKNYEKRRYHLYDPKRDFWKLVKFIIFSLTFVQPTFLSLKGYLIIRDRAWFLHPVICFLTVFNYGFSYYRHKR